MSKIVSEKKLYDTDSVVANVRHHLLSDFRTVLGPDFLAGLYVDDPFGRNTSVPQYYGTDIWRFRAIHQMRLLTKKYRSTTDPYTDEELQERTFKAFLANQHRLACRKPYKYATLKVLREARRIAREILGKFSEEDLVKYGRFGSKSNIGCPLACAYLDHKLWSREAFTGSWVAQRDFISKLSVDTALADSMNPWNIKGLIMGERCVDSLKLVLVPKQWDKHRPITPLPLLDLFRSFEIGGLVEERLRACGLNINRLQQIHAMLVHLFSKCRFTTDFGGSHVTADLSSASESIISDLLNYVLPRLWYKAVMSTTFRTISYGGRSFYCESVLPMGNGSTFPVETLIFYCLIKAIGNLSDSRGIYSVYGDDLIYPKKIHSYVVTVFGDLGLLLNADKTYVSEPFRESCGSDSFRGIEVRPFFFNGLTEQLTSLAFLSFLYKTINGLLRRWDKSEIPNTFGYLLRLANSVGYPLHRVPPSFPDNSGIRMEHHDESYGPFIDWAPVNAVFADGSKWYEFEFVHFKVGSRPVIVTEPYYWLALQGIDPWPDDWNDVDELPNSKYRPRLSWKRTPYTIRGKGGKLIRKLSKTRKAFVPTRDGSLERTRTRKRTISHWS